MDLLGQLFWVTLGAAAGGVLRYFVSGFVGRRIGEAFPWGTLIVNVSGAFAIGAMAACLQGAGFGPTREAWLFSVTGLLGAYTTVSSFSLQTLTLAREGEGAQAFNNILFSVVFCIAAAALGYASAVMARLSHG